MVSGFQFLVSGFWFLVSGFWKKILSAGISGQRLSFFGSRLTAHGSRTMDDIFMARGRPEVRGRKPEKRGLGMSSPRGPAWTG